MTAWQLARLEALRAQQRPTQQCLALRMPAPRPAAPEQPDHQRPEQARGSEIIDFTV